MGLAADVFAKNSFGWQLQKLAQWAQEGLERLFSRGGSSVPAPPPQVPAWLLQSIFWLLALIAAGWLSWQLYPIVRPLWESQRFSRPSPDKSSRTATDWLRQAQLAQAESDYATACRALYLATLQKLSEQNLIAPQSSRTDGEYLLLLRSLALPQPYQMLIQTHERLYFDRLAASAELYAECWQAYQILEQQARQPSSGNSA